jgi:arginine decarboxylase
LIPVLQLEHLFIFAHVGGGGLIPSLLGRHRLEQRFVYRSVVHNEMPVVVATGSGGTAVAAFHAALAGVGLAHYNLVRLSSVIPPQTSVDGSGKAPLPVGEWGDRLYCVYAERRAASTGEQAWAGIGWVQRLDGGGGFFVEHEGDSEQLVSHAIDTSLRNIIAGRENEFSAPDRVLNGAVCTEEPVSCLVLAAYQTAPWAGAR